MGLERNGARIYKQGQNCKIVKVIMLAEDEALISRLIRYGDMEEKGLKKH